MPASNAQVTVRINDRQYGLLDPASIQHLSGLELLRAMMTGKLPPPPMFGTLDYKLVSVEEGRVVFAGTPRVEFYNPFGVAHGSYAAALLDSAMACAVHSKLGPGLTYTTLEFKINFVRPLTAGTGEVQAIGSVQHSGKRTAVAEGKLLDADGALYATATTTCIVL